MRFRLGFVTGMATGYYFGARAGRQRYDQMNRAIAKLRRSDAFEEARDRARSAVEEAAELAKSAVEEGVEKARSALDSRANSTGNGHGADEEEAAGTTLPRPGGYSSSR